MKSAVETLSPTRVRLTVEVPFDELRPELTKAYKEIAQQVNIPGFRKGKVPPPVIDRQVGRGYVLEQAINNALPNHYVEALRENDIEPLGQPDIDLKRGGDGQDLEFTAELDVRPEVELPAYDDLSASVEDATVSDEDVDEQLQSLRERFGTLQTVERAAADDDHVTLDLSASKDGTPIQDAQLTGYTYKVGTEGLVDGIDEALRGMSAGEETTFTSRLVAGEYADQDVDIAVKVEAVKEQQLPELDDDFAQLASEFDTLDELRADVRDRLERSRRVDQANAARDAVLDALLERVEVPLPEKAVQDEIDARKANMRQELEQMGVSWEAYLQHEEKTDEEIGEDLDQRVRRAMKAEFVLDKLADAIEVSVGQDELTNHLIMSAQQAGMDPNEYVQQVVQNGYVPSVVRQVRRNKALGTLAETSTVTDASGNPIVLKGLRNDGTYAPEDEAEGGEGAEAGDGAEATESEASGATTSGPESAEAAEPAESPKAAE